MTNSTIEHQLFMWGERAIRSSSGGLGYASSSILTQSGDGDGFDSAVPKGVSLSADLDQVDKAVNLLPVVQRIICIQIYQIQPRASRVKQSSQLGISRQALDQYIAAIHRKVSEYLEFRTEITCKIPIRVT